jgi:hypothetical protein
VEKYRKEGYAMVDLICNYYKQVESYPVLSSVKPNSIREKLPTDAPESKRKKDRGEKGEEGGGKKTGRELQFKIFNRGRKLCRHCKGHTEHYHARNYTLATSQFFCILSFQLFLSLSFG